MCSFIKKIGIRIGDLMLPTVIVQEGGYLSFCKFQCS